MATEPKDLEQAYEQLKELLNNNELMELYYAREKALRDWNDSMHTAEQRGLEMGIKIARKKEEKRVRTLSQLLMRDKRESDIPNALTDLDFRQKLFTEYGI